MVALSRKSLGLVGLSASILVLDQITKQFILGHFGLGEAYPVIWNFFNITYVQNKGAAFGIMANAHPMIRIPFFIVVPMIALGTIFYIFRTVPKRSLTLLVGLSLVVGGALGNLVDRLFLGFVVDFLDFHWRWGYHFPAFNVADSAICVGVGLVMIDLFAQDSARQEKTKTVAP